MKTNSIKELKEELKRERDALDSADLLLRSMRILLDMKEGASITSDSLFHRDIIEELLKVAKTRTQRKVEL